MIVEPPGSQPNTLRGFSPREALLALLALLAFFARVSTYHVAQAGSACGGLVTVSGRADPSEHGSLHGPRHDAASRLCEVTALEPPDVDKDALAAAPTVGIEFSFRPLPSLASQPLRMASQAWTSQSLISAALPRGPPPARC